MTHEIHERSKDNVINNGEVFTPLAIVDKMLDLITDKKAWTDPAFCFLEPSCGNGQILVKIFERRIKSGVSIEAALNSLIGLDISKVNIDDSILRLCTAAAAETAKCVKPGTKKWFDRAARIYAIVSNNVFQVKDSIAYIKGPLSDKQFFDVDPTGNGQVLSKAESRKQLKEAKAAVKTFAPFLKIKQLRFDF